MYNAQIYKIFNGKRLDRSMRDETFCVTAYMTRPRTYSRNIVSVHKKKKKYNKKTRQNLKFLTHFGCGVRNACPRNIQKNTINNIIIINFFLRNSKFYNKIYTKKKKIMFQKSASTTVQIKLYIFFLSIKK